MDNTETLLKERCAAEFDSVTPDVSTLVVGGLDVGRRLRRRRRLTTGAVAAVAVVAATATGITAMDRGMFDSDSAPADGTPQVQQLVPATERGMAAAVIAHLPDGYEGGAAAASDEESGFTGVAVGVSGELGAELMVNATADTERTWSTIRQEACSDQMACEFLTTPDGTRVVTVTGQDAGASITAAAAHQGDDVVIAVLTTAGSEAEVPLTVEDLVAIVSDPLVGLQTSQEMNDRGELIEDWSDEYSIAGYSDSGTSGAVRVSPPESAGEGAHGGGSKNESGSGPN